MSWKISLGLTVTLVLHFINGQDRQGKYLLQDATVNIQPADAKSNVQGELKIYNEGFGIFITGQITGLSPGKHGFHIHENGDLGNACVDAGGHFNPDNRAHGDIRDYHRHVGDLGNIIADNNGKATVRIEDKLSTLWDPALKNFVGGLAIVIHAGEDDLGLGGDAGSLLTGNAGARVACGIIESRRQLLDYFNPFKPSFGRNNPIAQEQHIYPQPSYYQYPIPSAPLPIYHHHPVLPYNPFIKR